MSRFTLVEIEEVHEAESVLRLRPHLVPQRRITIARRRTQLEEFRVPLIELLPIETLAALHRIAHADPQTLLLPALPQPAALRAT